MRIRPSLRLARAAAACVVAAGLGAASNAWSQSLIEALSTTYNSNPDLLASRALLRQTDEIAGPGRRQLAAADHALARVQQDRAGFLSDPDGADLLLPERQVHDLDDDPADLPRRQDRRGDQDGAGQHPGPARRARRHRAERAAGGRHVLRRPGAEHRHRRCPPQQRARADPAVGRHARALPRRRARPSPTCRRPRRASKARAPTWCRPRRRCASPRRRSSAPSASGRDGWARCR